jgi:antirestriction protein ArdC
MNAETLFESITDQLVAAIEAGAGDWVMPWHTLATAGTPTSIDGHTYRGLNALWLPMVASTHGWESGLWATYRGWQRHDAQVRRGEHGTQVLLWKRIDPKAPDTDGDTDEQGRRRSRLVARTFTVFAAEQVDGADQLVARRQHPGHDTPDRIAEADSYFAAVAACVTIGGNQACYQPTTDTIRIPHLAQFAYAPHYYSTLAHEHVHWTGHPGRLNRDLSGRFGSDAYAAEELVAELGAAMWSAQAGLSAATRHDHAAYLAHWLKILRQDPRSLVTVASRAQAAVDHLNQLAGLESARDPAD